MNSTFDRLLQDLSADSAMHTAGRIIIRNQRIMSILIATHEGHTMSVQWGHTNAGHGTCPRRVRRRGVAEQRTRRFFIRRLTKLP